MKMTVTLSKNDIESLIKSHLEKRFEKVGEVKIEVGQELRGNQMNEYYETVFKGASCQVEMGS